MGRMGSFGLCVSQLAPRTPPSLPLWGFSGTCSDQHSGGPGEARGSQPRDPVLVHSWSHTQVRTS